jgi:hypothetical protein
LIGGPVGQAGISEGSAALRALVAATTMEHARRLDTRKGQFERQVAAAAHDFGLALPGKGTHNPRRAPHGLVYRGLKYGEESRRRIGKRIGLQKTQGQGRKLVKVAPKQGFGQEEDVSPREKDRLIRSIGVGNTPAGDAPVVPIKVTDGLCEDYQRAKPGPSNSSQELIQMRPFGRFPKKTALDIEGKNRTALADRLTKEDRTI